MNYYENGQLTGYDIEFMKRFASYANLDFEIITMDYAAMLPALQSGKGDVIISDFFKTDERGQEVFYSDAYVVLHNSVLVRKAWFLKYRECWGNGCDQSKPDWYGQFFCLASGQL